MANLKEIAELCHRTIYPNPSQAPISREEFLRAAVIQYATAVWILSKEDPDFDVPSELLTEVELPVVDNEIDISGLDILNSLSGDGWLQQMGELNCGCIYIKSSLNLEKKLCGDDSVGDNKTFYIIGQKIKFPRGTHKNKLPITYANMATELDSEVIEVNEYLGGKVWDKLMQLYGNKFPEDKTQNNNSNN